MDFFTSLSSVASIFSEPEPAPQPSTPIDSDGGKSGTGCTVS